MWNKDGLNQAVKRYHLFTGDTYYPLAGLGNYVGSYYTEAVARREAIQKRQDWWYIVFTEEDGSLVVLDHGGSE
jgi:hypothetical protein